MNNDTSSKSKPSSQSREERLAEALRANLNRRKQLARAKKSRDGQDSAQLDTVLDTALDASGDTPREGS